MLPDHIIALQAAVDNRTSEAMAHGAVATTESVAAWHRVAIAQASLHAALASLMRREGVR